MKNTILQTNFYQATTSLETDFYQITMLYAYLMSGKANEVTGFESFIRHIKPEIAGKNEFYIFDGEQDVHDFMRRVKEEFDSNTFFDKFWKIFSTKINNPKKIYKKVKKAFDNVDKSFEYTVVPNGTKVYPKVPVFQFKGSKIIGQLIETPITNIINGQTGLASFKTFFPDEIETINTMEEIMGGKVPAFYIANLEAKAKEYRKATTKSLFEAAFRRAPNFAIACIASQIAIKNGWDGTSNTSLIKYISPELIGGTMAHAFIMAFDKEEDAFIAWNEIFPNGTMLIDTYDTINAIKTLIRLNIRPSVVRIDSDPIEKLAFEVRRIMDEAGWTEVKIYLSGDITPEKLIKWEKEKVPFDMCMAGTKYVNLNEMTKVNCGFVYKIVEYEKDGKSYYPYKKAFGKSNYPGLKRIRVDDFGNICMFINQGMGFENLSEISDKAGVDFISDIDFNKKEVN